MVPLIVMALLPAETVPAFSNIRPVIVGLDDLIALICFKICVKYICFILIGGVKSYAITLRSLNPDRIAV